MMVSWAAISPTQAVTRSEPRAAAGSGALPTYTASVAMVKMISVERSIETRVGSGTSDTASTCHHSQDDVYMCTCVYVYMCTCVHVYTASTCHQKASSVRQPDTSSRAQ